MAWTQRSFHEQPAHEATNLPFLLALARHVPSRALPAMHEDSFQTARASNAELVVGRMYLRKVPNARGLFPFWLEHLS